MNKCNNPPVLRMEPKPLPIWHEAFAGLDRLSLLLSPVYRGSQVPHGNGSPVVVVPGCFASDRSLRELHSWLSRIGYRPYFSGIGYNVRCPELSVELLANTVVRAYEETDVKVSMIGHSLGGLLARGAALRTPHAVSRVITLGSPVNGLAVHPLLLAAADLFRGDCDYQCLPPLQGALPEGIEETSVYTRDDGVVDPQTCHREDAEAIEVTGTHVGLTANVQVYSVIAEILDRCSHVADISQVSAANASFNPIVAQAA